MLVVKGSKVRIKRTKELGVVTKVLGGDMVKVLLEDDIEIPCFLDDLERPEQDDSSVKAKIVKPKSEQTPSKRLTPILPETKRQYILLKDRGVDLAFEAVKNVDGSVSSYNVFLLNSTPYNAIFSFVLKRNNAIHLKKDGQVISMEPNFVGVMNYDILSDLPTVEISLSRLTTTGTDTKIDKQIKLKPKPFFNKYKTAPLLEKKAYVFPIISQFTKEEKTKNPSTDLKTYTQINARPNAEHDYDAGLSEVQQYATFSNEIDLHIESLHSNPVKLTNLEIINIQLEAFERYLQEAVGLGIQKVFVIHGVGKGKLRTEIANRLKFHPSVTSFKNEYHPNYGFGATEVQLLH